MLLFTVPSEKMVESTTLLSAASTVTKVSAGEIDTNVKGNATEPSEIGWVTVSEDDKYAFGANFGYGGVSVFSIDGPRLSVERARPPKRTATGSSKTWLARFRGAPATMRFQEDTSTNCTPTPRKLVGYRIEDDCTLSKIAEVPVPHTPRKVWQKI